MDSVIGRLGRHIRSPDFNHFHPFYDKIPKPSTQATDETSSSTLPSEPARQTSAVDDQQNQQLQKCTSWVHLHSKRLIDQRPRETTKVQKPYAPKSNLIHAEGAAKTSSEVLSKLSEVPLKDIQSVRHSGDIHKLLNKSAINKEGTDKHTYSNRAQRQSGKPWYEHVSNNNTSLTNSRTSGKSALDLEEEGRYLHELKTELIKTKQELEETKNRLSRMMSTQLTDNNPNVADLSDKNRPTKLAERYSELYDNQWTDAFEVIGNGDERSTIERLRKLLEYIMRYCMEKSTEQMKSLREKMMLKKDCPVPVLVEKYLKDSRKMVAETAGQHQYETFIAALKQPENEYSDISEDVEDYIEEAFMLCWLMPTQDPPVYLDLDTHAGQPLNPNLYKAFTRNGPVIDYIVWPALFLFKGGSVLSKGVAQAK